MRLYTAAMVAALLLVSGCDLPGQTPGIPTGGTLTVAITSDPTSLNRFLAADPAALRASAPLFPDLYQANPDLSISPDLAASMPSLSADHKAWTVKLRPNARWSDGQAITADDVIATVAIERNPALVTDAVFDWSMLDKVTKVDTYTVRFELTSPYAPFLANSLTMFVVPAHIYGAVDVAKMGADPISQQPSVTGGPFRFDKRNKDEVDLVANPDYYAGRAHLDRMVFRILPDATAAANAIATGDIGWEPDLSASALDKLKGVAGLKVVEYPDLSFYDVRLNDRPTHLFGDKLVRLAFAYAIDKVAVVRQVTAGHGTTLWGDIAPESWAFDPAAVVKYKPDLAKAKDLMLQAGWVVGADGIATKGGKRFSTKFYVRNDAPARVMAVGIISAQARAIGMDLQPAPVPYYNPADKSSFFDPLKKGEYDLAFTGFASGADPDQYRIFDSSQLRPEKNPVGVNWTGYSNPQLDGLIDEERTTLTGNDSQTRTARGHAFAQIERLLGTDLVTYFMWADNNGQAFSSDVGGVNSGRQGSLMNLDNGRNTQAFAAWYLRSRQLTKA
jgi:peptide/nickel transport system substrate-binding protein